jgi:uncharacterized protein
MRILLVVFLLVFTSLGSHLSFGQNIPAAPNPVRYCNDYGNMLSEKAEIELERRLVVHYQNTQKQLVIVAVTDLGGYTVEEFAEKLFNSWGIGDKDKNDGLLILISRDDRKMRIEAGYGEEANITDARASSIISNILTPKFKEHRYFEGLMLAIDDITGISYNRDYSSFDTPIVAENIAEKAAQKVDKEPEDMTSFYIFLGILCVFAVLFPRAFFRTLFNILLFVLSVGSGGGGGGGGGGGSSGGGGSWGGGSSGGGGASGSW